MSQGEVTGEDIYEAVLDAAGRKEVALAFMVTAVTAVMGGSWVTKYATKSEGEFLNEINHSSAVRVYSVGSEGGALVELAPNTASKILDELPTDISQDIVGSDRDFPRSFKTASARRFLDFMAGDPGEVVVGLYASTDASNVAVSGSGFKVFPLSLPDVEKVASANGYRLTVETPSGYVSVKRYLKGMRKFLKEERLDPRGQSVLFSLKVLKLG